MKGWLVWLSMWHVLVIWWEASLSLVNRVQRALKPKSASRMAAALTLPSENSHVDRKISLV